MDLLSLVAVDDSFDICGAHEAANALANRFPRAPAAKSITP
jgi:hypothetical protein